MQRCQFPIFVIAPSFLFVVLLFPGAAGAQKYDVAIRAVELIPPGTVIEKTAPEGWSHLVIKSQPRAGAGDMHVVNDTTAELAGLLFTAQLVKVDLVPNAPERRFWLSRVAVGFGTNIKGRDVIVTPDTQKRLGADLGFLARMVLSRCDEELRKCRYVARGASMAIVDTPTVMRLGDRNRNVMLRFVHLIDPTTGGLASLVWVMHLDERGGYAGIASPIQWMPPNQQEDCLLYADANEFTLGIPSDRGLAPAAMPPGKKRIPFPEDLSAIGMKLPLSLEEAEFLETRLRELLYAAAAEQ